MEEITLEYVQTSIDFLQRRIHNGCGNHGCKIKAPIGQGTNSGCKCSPTRIARQLRDLADAIDERAGTVWSKEGE